MKNNLKKIIKTIVPLIILSFLLAGCWGGSDTRVTLKVNIYTDSMTNNGQVFYSLVRADDDQKFFSATFQNLYKDYLTDKTITKIFIRPQDGKITRKIVFQKGDSVSVYFLFSSETGETWKYRINNLEDDETYNFTIGQSSIIKVKKGGFSIF